MLNDIAYSGTPFALVKSARRRKSGVGTTRSVGPTPPSTLSAATRSCTVPFRSDDRPFACTGM